MTLTNEASKTQRSNLLIFHFRTAVISRRAKKATALAEKKRPQELEKLAVKVAKASTENSKTRMSKTVKILARKKGEAQEKQPVSQKRKGPPSEQRRPGSPILSETHFMQSSIQFFFWFQDKRKREDQRQKERERKRAAYAKKKNALEELHPVIGKIIDSRIFF